LRSCGANAHTGFAGCQGPALSHVRGGLLVPDIDNPYAHLDTTFEDRVYVSSDNAEKMFDAIILHYLRC
jgi:hypothetical protein